MALTVGCLSKIVLSDIDFIFPVNSLSKLIVAYNLASKIYEKSCNKSKKPAISSVFSISKDDIE